MLQSNRGDTRFLLNSGCFRLVGFLVSLFLTVFPFKAYSQGFETQASYALLVDYKTGTILFEKNSSFTIIPGAIVKVMTAEVIFHALMDNKISLETEFSISENAWRKGGGPSGGTAMFAELNSRVSVANLLRGLIIHSANDAAYALAEGLLGNEQAFVALMNERAKVLGLKKTTFANATGFPAPNQQTSLQDLVVLAKHVITKYPAYFPFFKESEFTWNKIRQLNRNTLIGANKFADGFMVGQTTESGAILLGSAVINNQRFIIVIGGHKNYKETVADANKLLDWGSQAFKTYNLFSEQDTVAELTTYGGDKGTVVAVTHNAVDIFLTKSNPGKLTAKILYKGPIEAPIKKGTEIGCLTIYSNKVVLLETPVYAGEDVGRGGIMGKAVDNVVDIFLRQFHRVTNDG